jgi:hypothetical protein
MPKGPFGKIKALPFFLISSRLKFCVVPKRRSNCIFYWHLASSKMVQLENPSAQLSLVIGLICVPTFSKIFFFKLSETNGLTVNSIFNGQSTIIMWLLVAGYSLIYWVSAYWLKLF